MRKIIDNKYFAWQKNSIFEGEKSGTEAREGENYSIAIIIDTAIGVPPVAGVTYRLYYLSKALQNRGHEIVWIIGNRNFNKEDDLREMQEAGISIHLLHPKLFYNAEYVSDILKTEGVDIVQYEITQTFLQIGIRIRKLNDIPVVLECHDVEADLRETLGRNQESALMEFLQKAAGTFADAVVAMTPKDQSTLQNRIGVQKEKMFLAPNGIESDQASYRSISKEGDVLLFLGNMFYQPNKQAAVFIVEELLPRIQQEVAGVKAKFIGMTPDDLKSRFKNNPHVIFKGKIKDEEKFNSELSSSTIGLCPVYAGSGMKVKILNYALVELPIVSTSIGASGYEKLNEIVIEDNEEKMAEKIISLLQNKKERVRIGQCNRQEVLSYYSWESISQTMEDAYYLAKRFHVGQMKKKNIQPFWLEEGRDEQELLEGHYLINEENYEKKNSN